MRPIAFYAPLKTPNHPTPSGDRQVARNTMKALSLAFDREVSLVSELRSFEPKGDLAAQHDLLEKAQAEVARLATSEPKPVLWVTYHNYYKAPDLIGPAVSKALNIPYAQVEATRAKSRLNGPWAQFAKAAHDASDAADVILHVTQEDLFALERDRFGNQQIVELPPFLDLQTLPEPSTADGPMLAVGMVRHGDKLASYQLIAETLAALPTGDWQLNIAGDGEARAEVEALFAPLRGRVSYLGALNANDLQAAYANSSLLFWPGVNEAFGMVYLEAQAAGLPVLAQDRPGVRDVLVPGSYPDPADGAPALAQRLSELLSDAQLRQQLGAAGREYVCQRHLMPAAVKTLRETLGPLIEGYR